MGPPIPFPGNGPPDPFPGRLPPNVELPFSTSKGIALFTAYDGINGFELWMTDGTEAGTMLLKDIWPGDGNSVPINITVFGDQVLLSADDGTNGRELWMTDGTAEGTTLLKDIWPGDGSSLSSNIQFTVFTVFGGQVLFAANDGINGVELWATDGTAEGTTLVKDILPGSSGSVPSGFTVLGDQVLFAANDGINGVELWATDGTQAGTTLVKDIWPGSSGSSPREFTVLGDQVVFYAGDGTNGRELWVADGTQAGTTLVKDIWPGPSSSEAGYQSGADFTVLGDQVLFAANDGINGVELWATDGTQAGTTLVKDIWPGSSSSEPNRWDGFTVFGDKVLFTADDGAKGRELWVTDGTAEGTTLVKDIRPGSSGSDPLDITVFGDQVLFSANDGTTGRELWVTDGTEAGTVLLKDIWPGSSSSSPGVYSGFTVFDDQALFSADDGTNGFELWTTDGTDAGTMLLKDILPGSSSSVPGEFGGFTVFGGETSASANDGGELPDINQIDLLPSMYVDAGEVIA